MQRKKNILNASTLLIGIALGALLFFGVQRWANQIVSIVTTPFLYTQHTITSTIQHVQKKRAERSAMANEIEQLKKENHRLVKQLTEYAAQNAVYANLEPLLSFAQRYNLTGAVAAQVLLKQLSTENQYILVGAGSNKHIHKNDIALAHHQLIGKVVEVFPFYSKVQLITDPKSRISVECASTKTRGIAEGTGSSKQLNLSFAVHFSELKDQDLVLSLGTGLIFPRGFGIGTVTTQATNNVFHTASITPLINIEQLEECLLVSRAALEGLTFVSKKNIAMDKAVQKTHAEKTGATGTLAIPRPPQEISLESQTQQPAYPAAKKAEYNDQKNQSQKEKAGKLHAFGPDRTKLNDADDAMRRHDTDQRPSGQYTKEPSNTLEQGALLQYD